MDEVFADVGSQIVRYSSPQRKAINLKFFKSGKGEYGEGDEFIGLAMPDARKIAKQWIDVDYSQIQKLVSHTIHEYRMIGFLILLYQFERVTKKLTYDENKQRNIFDFTIKYRSGLNNWDLVDVICPRIIGGYLFGKPDLIDN